MPVDCAVTNEDPSREATKWARLGRMIRGEIDRGLIDSDSTEVDAREPPFSMGVSACRKTLLAGGVGVEDVDANERGLVAGERKVDGCRSPVV